MPDYSSIECPADDRFARCQLHGVLVRVFGIGVLLTGEAGIGKTSGAIELMRRGHALIADDAVQVFQRGESLIGTAPEMTRALVHLRGVGIAKVADVAHRAAVLDECMIDMNIEISMSHRNALMPPLSVPFFRIEPDHPIGLADQIEAMAGNRVC